MIYIGGKYFVILFSLYKNNLWKQILCHKNLIMALS